MSLFNFTNGGDHVAPGRVDSSEVVAGMFVYGHFEDVMRIRAIKDLDAYAGRRAFPFGVLVYFKLQLHTNVYHLWNYGITLVKVLLSASAHI